MAYLSNGCSIPGLQAAVARHRVRPWHHRWVTSSSLEHLARTAYEAHRGAHPADLPPWEETTEQEQQAWKVAVSAVAAQTGTTLIEKASPARSLVIQAGDKRHTFQSDFTAGRQGNLAISDDFASGHHCRFWVAHGLRTVPAPLPRVHKKRPFVDTW